MRKTVYKNVYFHTTGSVGNLSVFFSEGEYVLFQMDPSEISPDTLQNLAEWAEFHLARLRAAEPQQLQLELPYAVR